MSEPVKSAPDKRHYDNSRREARTRATRAAVVAAAGELFVARGYPATTIEVIAEAAGIPLATVYRLFGSKRGILSAVLDVAFGGDDEPVEYQDRDEVRSALAEPDPGTLLDNVAHLARELLARSAPLQQVLAGAAAADPEAADLLAVARQQRRTGQSMVIHQLAERGALAEGLDEAEAADIAYALMSPELHRILTVESGWGPERYERLLATALRALILDEGQDTRRTAHGG